MYTNQQKLHKKEKKKGKKHALKNYMDGWGQKKRGWGN